MLGVTGQDLAEGFYSMLTRFGSFVNPSIYEVV